LLGLKQHFSIGKKCSSIFHKNLLSFARMERSTKKLKYRTFLFVSSGKSISLRLRDSATQKFVLGIGNKSLGSID